MHMKKCYFWFVVDDEERWKLKYYMENFKLISQFNLCSFPTSTNFTRLKFQNDVKFFESKEILKQINKLSALRSRWGKRGKNVVYVTHCN